MTGYYGPAAGLPDLAAALARASRYRESATVLTVACPNDHALVRLLDTERGRVLLWEQEGWAATDDSTADRLATRRDSRQTAWALEVEGPTDGGWLHAECRCSSTRVSTAEVLAAAAAGRRRVRALPTDVRGLSRID